MAFTYDITTDRGKVRARIGDVVDLTGVDESLSDAEVDYALSVCNSNIARTAVFALELLIAKLRVKVSRSTASISSSVREKVENAEKLREMLLERSKTNKKVAYYGGSSDSRRESAAGDTDFIKPSFTIGRDDIQGAGQSVVDSWEDD